MSGPAREDRRWGGATARGAVSWLLALGVSAGALWLADTAWRTMIFDQGTTALQLTDTPGAIALLTRTEALRPDLADGWRLLAVAKATTDPNGARADAAQAVAVDPQDWRGWRTLSTIDFQLGNQQQARSEAQRATEFNSGFEAHYQLANLAFLLGENEEFWSQMKLAMAVAGQSQQAVVAQGALHLGGGDVARFESIVPYDRPGMTFVAAEALLEHKDFLGSLDVLGRSRCGADVIKCRAATVLIVSRAVKAALEGAAPLAPVVKDAVSDWNRAVDAGALQQDRARVGKIADGKFQRVWAGPVFSWSAGDWKDIAVEGDPAGISNVIRANFDGSEPDNLRLLLQLVPVSANTKYSLEFRSQCQCSGLAFTAREAGGSHAILATIPIPDSTQFTGSEGAIVTPQGAAMVELALEYHRPFATPPLTGTVRVSGVALRP